MDDDELIAPLAAGDENALRGVDLGRVWTSLGRGRGTDVAVRPERGLQ
jgi:hypothetical protein